MKASIKILVILILLISINIAYSVETIEEEIWERGDRALFLKTENNIKEVFVELQSIEGQVVKNFHNNNIDNNEIFININIPNNIKAGYYKIVIKILDDENKLTEETKLIKIEEENWFTRWIKKFWSFWSRKA